MFKADKEKAQPSDSSFLTNPYLGPVKPVDVRVEKVGSVEDCFVVEFKLLSEDFNGNDVSGIHQNYVEWNPSSKTEDKQKNAANRLAYVVSHLVSEDNEEKVFQIEADSWKEYATKMAKLLKQDNFTDRDDIVFKWQGDVYQGKPKITNPNYHNFIADDRSEEDLTWNPGELDSNKEYIRVKNSSPDDPEDVGEGDDLEDQSF